MDPNLTSSVDWNEHFKNPNINPQYQQLLTFGYIHEQCKQRNVIIPESLINAINLFYPTTIKFHQIFIYDGIEPGKNGQRVRMNMPKYGFSMAFIDKIISGKMCKGFNINFKFECDLTSMFGWAQSNSGSITPTHNFAFGYMSSSEFNKDRLRNGSGLGHVCDTEYGIRFVHGNNGHKFRVSNYVHFSKAKKDFDLGALFQKDDTFGLIFDFEDDRVTLLYNDTSVGSISLFGLKDIIILLALSWGCPLVIISDWSFL